MIPLRTLFAATAMAAFVSCSSLNCDDAKGKVRQDVKIGASYAGVGLNVCVSKEEATKFDGKLGVLALRYGENCEAFKDGKITKGEYEQRNRDLDQILASVEGFSRGWHDWVNGMKRDAFADMDKQLGKLSDESSAEQPKQGPPELRTKFLEAMNKLDTIDHK
ncbi:MAG: hypothetical protein U1E76_18495 [Planctomycetota bacterium]